LIGEDEEFLNNAHLVHIIMLTELGHSLQSHSSMCLVCVCVPALVFQNVGSVLQPVARSAAQHNVIKVIKVGTKWFTCSFLITNA